MILVPLEFSPVASLTSSTGYIVPAEISEITTL
jgi:hypothetical protein